MKIIDYFITGVLLISVAFFMFQHQQKNVVLNKTSFLQEELSRSKLINLMKDDLLLVKKSFLPETRVSEFVSDLSTMARASNLMIERIQPVNTEVNLEGSGKYKNFVGFIKNIRGL